jgi:hypothetical protein
MSRHDGWIVSFDLTIYFDTDFDRTRYDHVGTEVRCRCCRERLTTWTQADLDRHARNHESELSLDDGGRHISQRNEGGLVT